MANMAITANSIITWGDFSMTCYNAIVSQCCNIDTYKNVPTRLQLASNPTLAATEVKSISGIGISGSTGTWSTSWSATPADLVDLVASATVLNEWQTYLADAGIILVDSDTGNITDNIVDSIIKAKEFTLIICLYMGFLSYHLKPIYSRRQIYNTVEAQNLFEGIQYVSGTLKPIYKLRETDDPSIPLINPDTYDSTQMIKNNFMWQVDEDGTIVNKYMLDSWGNPRFAHYTLS